MKCCNQALSVQKYGDTICSICGRLWEIKKEVPKRESWHEVDFDYLNEKS